MPLAAFQILDTVEPSVVLSVTPSFVNVVDDVAKANKARLEDWNQEGQAI